jgi:hypothetical protein
MTDECVLCFEKKVASSKPNPQPQPNICRHWETICFSCLSKLRRETCPYCAQDWSTALGKKSLPPIWYAIFYLMVLWNNDLPLLEYLIHKRNMDPGTIYPFEQAAILLTGVTDVKMAEEAWNALPNRESVQRGLLLCQGIQWDSLTQSYKFFNL